MTDEKQAVPVAQELKARKLLTDFHTSASYDPHAKRHADTVEAAIRFTISSLANDENVKFVAMVSRLTHTGDDGWTPPSDDDDSSSTLDGLIAEARDIRSASLPCKSGEGAEPVGAVEWRCYHCGDVFTNDACARLHFGRDEDSIPACRIKAGAEQGLLGALRDAEYAAADAQQAVANECTDAAKAYYAQATRHNQAMRNAEELGYERGLADGRALSTPSEQFAKSSPDAELREAAQEAHDTLHECTAVLTASDCKKVAATMSRVRAALNGRGGA